jgi:hypothetical protein
VTAQPRKEQLVAPLNNAQLAKPKVRLKWHTAAGAQWYALTVKKGDRIVVQQNQLTTTQFQTAPLVRGRSYRWQVRACNAVGCRASPWWEFTLRR